MLDIAVARVVRASTVVARDRLRLLVAVRTSNIEERPSLNCSNSSSRAWAKFFSACSWDFKISTA